MMSPKIALSSHKREIVHWFLTEETPFKMKDIITQKDFGFFVDIAYKKLFSEIS